MLDVACTVQDLDPARNRRTPVSPDAPPSDLPWLQLRKTYFYHGALHAAVLHTQTIVQSMARTVVPGTLDPVRLTSRPGYPRGLKGNDRVEIVSPPLSWLFSKPSFPAP